MHERTNYQAEEPGSSKGKRTIYWPGIKDLLKEANANVTWIGTIAAPKEYGNISGRNHLRRNKNGGVT